MPVLVDPTSGQRYDYADLSDEETAKDQKTYGLITPEQYAARQKAEAEGPLVGAGRALVKPVVGLTNLGMKAGLLDAPPNAEEQAKWDAALADFGLMGEAHSEVNPVSSFAGEAVGQGTLGAVSAGAGAAVAGTLGASALVGGGAGLLAESATSGVSQEAIDAVTEKRDFSAKSALMKGGIDLAFNLLGAGAGHLAGRFLGDAAEAGTRAEGRGLADAVEPEQSVPAGRNILAELDPGEVPEAIGGAARAGKRRPKSAGAAASAGRSYAEAKAANDTGLSEDLYDAASRELRDGPDGKPLAKEAQFLADNSDSLTELAAQNTADHLDDVGKILKEDVSLDAKIDDLKAFESTWTPEQRAAQSAWAKNAVESQADDILRTVEAGQKAAADVRAGRSGAREAGVEAIDAGGIDARIGTALRMGLDKVRRAEGAAQAEAVDQLKRSVGGLVKDIGRSGSLDEGTKKARIELLDGYYKTLQEGLQDEAKYGRFGALQKDTNAALTDLIEAKGRLDSRLTERLGDTYGAVGQQAINRRAVAGKVAGIMRSGPLEQRELFRDVAAVNDALRRLTEARRAHGLGRLERLDRLEKGLSEFADDLKFARTLQVAQRVAKDATPGLGERLAGAGVDLVAGRVPVVGGALKKEGQGLLQRLTKSDALPAKGTALREAIDNRLKAYSRNTELADIGYSGTLPRWLQETLRGHGGQVAGVAGVVGAGALLAPGEAGAAEFLPEQKRARDEVDAQLAGLPPDEVAVRLRTAEAFARIGHDVNRRVEGAVSSLFAVARDPRAPPPHRSPAARALDKRAAELDVPRHMARFMGRHDDPVAAWKEKSQTVTEIATNPAKVARRMAQSLGDLPRQQPEIFAAMVAETVATGTYLYETRPVTSGKSALSPEGYPPTHEEIDEWAGRWVGALHPLDTLDDLGSNDLVPEQMEAVQARWPEAYTMFQTAAMKQIHELSQLRRPIPIEALEQIDSALDLDGAGEPTLSSAMAQLLRQAEQAEEQRLQQEAQNAPPPPGPSQPNGPARLASSALGSLHGAGA